MTPRGGGDGSTFKSRGRRVRVAFPHCYQQRGGESTGTTHRPTPSPSLPRWVVGRGTIQPPPAAPPLAGHEEGSCPCGPVARSPFVPPVSSTGQTASKRTPMHRTGRAERCLCGRPALLCPHPTHCQEHAPPGSPAHSETPSSPAALRNAPRITPEVTQHLVSGQQVGHPRCT